MSHGGIFLLLGGEDTESRVRALGRVLIHLLPPSKIWRFNGVISGILLGSGDELERVESRALDLIREADPQQALELLPDYERMLELSSDGTLGERRARVVSLLIRRQRVRPIDYQSILAPILGVTPTVVEHTRAFAILVGDDREIYRFFIYRNPALPGTYDLVAAQAMIDRMSLSHTKGYVIESINFLCDDPYSLCDRDILGV